MDIIFELLNEMSVMAILKVDPTYFFLIVYERLVAIECAAGEGEDMMTPSLFAAVQAKPADTAKAPLTTFHDLLLPFTERRVQKFVMNFSPSHVVELPYFLKGSISFPGSSIFIIKTVRLIAPLDNLIKYFVIFHVCFI